MFGFPTSSLGCHPSMLHEMIHITIIMSNASSPWSLEEHTNLLDHTTEIAQVQQAIITCTLVDPSVSWNSKQMLNVMYRNETRARNKIINQEHEIFLILDRDYIME